MAPNSYHSSTSSLEALNGSAVTSPSMYQTDPPSYSAPASITHVTYANLARYPAGAPQSNGTSNYSSVNETHAGLAQYGHETESYASRGQSQVPTAYATSYYSAESEYANQPYSNDTFYPPSTTSYAGNAVYASELSIEEQGEQNGTANEQYPNENGTEPEATYPWDYNRPQNGFTAPQQHSPSVRRWSRENAPEERLRIGLPRWESEQHRIDYEQGRTQAPRQPQVRSRPCEQRRRGDHSRRTHTQ